MRKINVAITINIKSPTESFFTNGVKQHAVNLRDLFLNCKNIANVYFINLGSQQDLSQSPWKDYQSNIINVNQVIGKVDLVIELMAGIKLETSKHLQNNGIKVVKQAVGTEYHMFAEYMLFQDSTPGFDQRAVHQAVWILPHHYDANKDYFEIMCESPAYKSPFIWSPKFLQQEINNLGKNQQWEYQSKSDSKKISVIEPNINLVKTCLTPILAGEKLFQKHPDKFNKLSVFCSESVRGKKEFVKFVTNLKIYQNKKMFFENRYHILHVLSKHTDIVLCHQRDLELNYAYFDVAWLGYPLVHNSSMLQELGYYYEGFDADQAADQIIHVIDNFDVQKDEYLKKSREYINQFLPNDPANIDSYESLIENAMK